MIPLPDTLCELDGDLIPLNEAKVSVLDRGFLFGDGIYDVVPVYGARLFRFDDHMARLARGLAELRIAPPRTREEWLASARRLVDALHERTGAVDQLVYFQVTRGVALRDHVMPADITPTIFMMVNPMKPATAEQRAQGVACVSARDFRWEKGHLKSISLLGNVFARQLSADVGALETIMFRDGQLTEAAASNVWIVRNGEVLGPPASEHLLEGIRVGLMEELCAQAGIPFARRPITEEEVRAADELLLSSATKEILPVTRLDGVPVGASGNRGAPGPVYARLYAAYQVAKLEQSI
jgi:D-alanine transaminase